MEYSLKWRSQRARLSGETQRNITVYSQINLRYLQMKQSTESIPQRMGSELIVELTKKL